MHPILANRRHLALYLVAWIPVMVLLSAALVMTGWGGWLQSLFLAFPLVVVFAFLCLAAWYPCRAMPLDGGPIELSLLTHIAAAALSAGLWVALARIIAEGFNRSKVFPVGGGLVAGQAWVIFVSGVLLYLLSVTIHYLFAAAEISRAAERRALEAEVAARDAELQALKAQLNPHFLFNSLNSVASLAVSDPSGARDMCIQLGDYLRGTLKSEDSHLHPFGEEMAQVRRFLRVEAVRYGDRLRVEEQIGDGCLELAVPTLLLQPLVENSLKHGIAELVEGGTVRIGARRSGDRLVVWVANPVDEAGVSRSGTGVGLANVRRRLEKVYGDAARLRTDKTEDGYRAEVVIPAIRGDGGARGREDDHDG
jgi:LytS/YehU family sensor histidine kinase